MFNIVKREEMAQGTIVLNEISAPLIAAKAKAGQFVILKSGEEGERIPLTIADTDLSKGTITIVYMIIGKSTAKFSTLKVGDSYTDIIGPLGRPTHIEKRGKVVCVGGGTGIAVLHPIARALKAAGNEVITILGSRNKDLLIFEERMKKASTRLIICSDDGSYGRKALVTEPLKELLAAEDIKEVVAIGPVPMMKFVSLTTKEKNIPTVVSLNPIMIDGTGMCGCCRVLVDNKPKFVCVDGPEFDAHKVDFDGLTKRLAAYRPEETAAYETFKKSVAK